MPMYHFDIVGDNTLSFDVELTAKDFENLCIGIIKGKKDGPYIPSIFMGSPFYRKAIPGKTHSCKCGLIHTIKPYYNQVCPDCGSTLTFDEDPNKISEEVVSKVEKKNYPTAMELAFKRAQEKKG